MTGTGVGEQGGSIWARYSSPFVIFKDSLCSDSLCSLCVINATVQCNLEMGLLVNDVF